LSTHTQPRSLLWSHARFDGNRMGRTYEQVDAGEVSRTKGAAATDRESNLAATVQG
jgi:hypothetical protein